MLFGIIALLIVGASWCLVGVIFGLAPKKGLNTGAIQLGSAIVTIAAGGVIYHILGPAPCPARILFAVCGTYALSGVFNYYGLQAMAEGMKRGPNGIVWCIMQSALIFSFLGGIVFFGERLTFFRGGGIVLLVAALILFGLAKDNSNWKSSSWRMWAFFALALIAIQQNICNAPSFFPSARTVHPVLRSISVASGTLAAALIGILIRSLREKGFGESVWSSFRRPLMWLFVVMPLFFSLIFAYTLFYPGMDAMAKAGAGSVNYPLMVGSCIVSFTLYSFLFLRERLKPMQIAALILCVVGLACLCVPV